MTAFELDPAYCRLHIDSNEVVVHWGKPDKPRPWPGLHTGQHIHVEIAGRVSPATVVAIRARYAIARLTPGGAA